MIHNYGSLSIKSTSQAYPGKWETPSSFSGVGITVEGKLIEIRNHTIEDSMKRMTRFIALVFSDVVARNRVYNDKGEEIDTQVKKEKLEKKGFLNKYDHVQLEDEYRIESNELARRMSKTGGNALPNTYFDIGVKSLHPHVKDTFEFWCESKIYKQSDFTIGVVYRLKTKGDSIFIESISRLDEISRNFAGEDVKTKWDNKIDNIKGLATQTHHGPIPGQDREGVAEDEWN